MQALEASHTNARELLGQFGESTRPEEAYALLHRLEDMLLRMTETLGTKMEAVALLH